MGPAKVFKRGSFLKGSMNRIIFGFKSTKWGFQFTVSYLLQGP